jgi:CP family cyanate transporter-like MFS transporter
VSFGTAVYSNGLLVAETVAVLLTIPIVLPLVDNSWRLSLAV